MNSIVSVRPKRHNKNFSFHLNSFQKFISKIHHHSPEKSSTETWSKPNTNKIKATFLHLKLLNQGNITIIVPKSDYGYYLSRLIFLSQMETKKSPCEMKGLFWKISPVLLVSLNLNYVKKYENWLLVGWLVTGKLLQK